MVPTDKQVTVKFLGRERPLVYNYGVYCRIQQKLEAFQGQGARPRNMLDPEALRVMALEPIGPTPAQGEEQDYKVNPLLNPVELAIFLWGGLSGDDPALTVDQVIAELNPLSALTFLRIIAIAVFQAMPKPTVADGEETPPPAGPPQPPTN